MDIWTSALTLQAWEVMCLSIKIKQMDIKLGGTHLMLTSLLLLIAPNLLWVWIFHSHDLGCCYWSINKYLPRHVAQIQIMQTTQKPGVVINLGSASGLYPMYADPIYSASKGLLGSSWISHLLYFFFLGLRFVCFHISSLFHYTKLLPLKWGKIIGGVVMFTRSLALYKRQGIRINVLCPEVKYLNFLYIYIF